MTTPLGTGSIRTRRLDEAIAASKRSCVFDPSAEIGEETGAATFGNVFDDIGDAISDSPVIRGIGKVLRAIAPFVAMIPGIGTIAGTAMYAVGSVAAGQRLDDVAIGTIRAALPENLQKTYDDAISVGYKVANGESVDQIALDEARQVAQDQGGNEGVALFDMAVSVGRGRGLQDAGFKLMAAWVAGSDAGERAVEFATDLTKAAEKGQSVGDFIRDEAVAQFIASVPALKQAYYLEQAIEYFFAHPEMLLDYVERIAEESAEDFAKRNVPTAEHPNPMIPKVVVDWWQAAEDAGVPVEAVRGAIICIIQLLDGSLILNQANAEQFDKTRVTISPDFSASTWTDSYTLAAFQDITDAPAVKERNDTYERQGQALVALNTEISTARRGSLQASWIRGFDIGTIISLGHTLAGPQQDAIRSSINVFQQAGFDVARAQQYAAANAGKKFVTLDDLRALGYRVAVLNPVVSTMRAALGSNATSSALWAFDIGTAITMGKSLNGPGQTMIYMALADADRPAFDAARKIQYGSTNQRVTMITGLTRANAVADADKGRSLAAAYAVVARARVADPSSEYRFGFDVGTGATVGKSVAGPGQTMVRDLLGPSSPGMSADGTGPGTVDAQRGFDAAQILQFQITMTGGYTAAMSTVPNPVLVNPAAVTQAVAPITIAAAASPIVPASRGFFSTLYHFLFGG